MTLTLVSDIRRACPAARTDRQLVTEATAWLSTAITAGIDTIQLREHELPAATLRELTRGVVSLCDGTPTTVLVNNRADVALIAGAHGVHLRDDHWPASRVRALNPAWILGRSVHDETTAQVADGVDFLVFGAVFGSDGKPARGVDALRDVVDASRVPVVAIGGITAENAHLATAAGAAGVAAISLFLPEGSSPGALGPAQAISRLRSAAGTVYS
jgi:thiamine-phosphate pyrophosphorylase